MGDHSDWAEIVPEMKCEIIDEREPETTCNGVGVHLPKIGHMVNYSCDLVKIPLKIPDRLLPKWGGPPSS